MNYSYYEFQPSLPLKPQISHINEKVHIMYEIVTATSFFSTIQFAFNSTRTLQRLCIKFPLTPTCYASFIQIGVVMFTYLKALYL
jgi:hypothetical protein